MYSVWYYCPRQSPNWQHAGNFLDFYQAQLQAEVVKPPAGRAQVRDFTGNIVYSL